MRLLHYLEIENFKSFGELQRIELDHPSVFIGPNNCGKTTALQAIALWSQAVKTWFQSRGKTIPMQPTATALNRLNIVAVPVQRTRHLWHNAVVRVANEPVRFRITLGVLHDHRVESVSMLFRNQGDELVFCIPDNETVAKPDLLETAAGINVELLYPLSGLETEEPTLQPGRIEVLLGQGLTSQVIRNLCLSVYRENPENWAYIVVLMKRFFAVDLGAPSENARGSIDLTYRQPGVKDPLELALAGRGLQQMLLILAYLHSRHRTVLLIDEPDAHLELLRQKQVYVLLREIAAQNESQVILVTHSEAILAEAMDRNLTLLLGGQTDNLAASEIRNVLRHYGTEHYIRALERGYVLYVEGRADLDIMRALARNLRHEVVEAWDERINAYYLQDNYPKIDLDSEPANDSEGLGVTAQRHFLTLRSLVPQLKGLAIFGSEVQVWKSSTEGNLEIAYWNCYEAANYLVTPATLTAFALDSYQDAPLFQPMIEDIESVLNPLIVQRVFHGQIADFQTWQSQSPHGARLLWEARTDRLKMSDFAAEFFRILAQELGHTMLLRKGEFHRLAAYAEPQSILPEVSEKLDLLQVLFASAR